MDTYKAAKLNSLLSQLNFRIDPIEQVLGERKKREAATKARLKTLNKQKKAEQAQLRNPPKKKAPRAGYNESFNKSFNMRDQDSSG